MINRNNWKLTRKYLVYRKEVDLLSEDSILVEEAPLRYALEWAQETSFIKAPDIRPTLPDYLAFHRPDAEENPFSKDYLNRVINILKRFFQWLIDTQRGYKHLDNIWIKKLKAPRLVEKPKEYEAVSYEEIIAMAQTPVHSIQDMRTRAMVCFLYLSGMRIGAFVSLPLLAVDLDNLTIKQHPNLGVKTKFSKHATTFLLNIPELLEVVREWDHYVRERMPENGYWFAPLSPRTRDIDTENIGTTQTRRNLARKNLNKWCKKNNLTYHKPHAFRHGHIHYGLKLSQNMEDYKAVSLNVMHSNMGITDQIYSHISNEEVQNRINQLGKSSKTSLSEEQKQILINQILKL